MTSQDISPARYVLIGLLLLAPVAGFLTLLALDGAVKVEVAAICFAVVAGVAFLILRTIHSDARTLARYLDRLADADAPIPPPLAMGTGTQTLIAAVSRMHQDWIDRSAAAERRAAGGDAVVEAMHDPLILVDAQRRVALANAAARTLFGDRMAGRDLAVSLRNPALLEAVDAVMGGGPSRSVEFVLPIPVERTLEARVKPFPRAEGDPSLAGAILLTLHDITLLKRSEQMRADFVANASHELRTPLSTLLGFIETLRGPARDDEEARDRFLAIMHEQASRMARLVADLLSLSRIELDEHSPPVTRVAVDGIVRNVAAMLEMKAAGRRIRLRIGGTETLPHLLGDEDQLSQVFQNLIENAIKYGREGTDVDIVLASSLGGERRGGPAVSVAVTDRGEGIPKTHLPRLTERFYRVDPARSRALGGTGLGLAIVKHILNRHRGRLTIDSEVGAGSTFTVHLPALVETGTAQDLERTAVR